MLFNILLLIVGFIILIKGADKMEIFDKIKSIISDELNIDQAKITREANIREDLGADSLDAVEVIMALEDEFGITIDDDTAQSFKTVGDLVDYVEKNAQ